MKNKTLKSWSDTWLVEATIDQLQAKMEAGTLTARDLVLMYLERIATYDKRGPKINSVLELNPDALQIAEALDHERRTKGTRGPMHGIPVLLKDNIDTGDKMHTSAGSLALADHTAKEDAVLARKLREAGAILLGKLNMTEWANYMTNRMPSGYSSRGGQTKNPYRGDYLVGGSSSGSGAAVAANFATVTVGTETAGSILYPASANACVGIKPTVGLISRRGVIPIAHSQDTPGPMARTVADAAILLNALAGADELDPITRTSVGQAAADYTQFLDADALKGKRIGVVREFFKKIDAEHQELMEAAFEAMRDAGAEVFDVELPSANADWDHDVLKYEYKVDLNAYLANCGPQVPVHSLRELIAYNMAHPDSLLKYGQTLLLASEETSGTLTEPAYINSREKDLYLSRTAGIDPMMAEHRLDAWVFPASWGSHIPAKAGYPSINVPAGASVEKGPVGISFSGLAYSEGELIALAYAFEQRTQHRVPPKM
ncbi:amidase [Tumebacillus lacus]|uniref:amidase n=1 Tax=Tumebacillus lacus TaxID=2995335 RepID=UPI00389AB942